MQGPLPDPKSARAEFFRRVDKALDYIEANAGRDITREELAAVSGLSAMYLDRILSDATGKSASRRVLDNRLERAARLLKDNPHRTVAQIGDECGFTDRVEFARAFSRKFGSSPSAWRHLKTMGIAEKAEFPQGLRDRTELPAPSRVGDDDAPGWCLRTDSFGNVTVRIEEMTDLNLACVRYVGPYLGIGKAFRLLSCWALERQLMRPESLILGVYHDIPDATRPEDLRSDACITVPLGTKKSVPVTIRTLACKGTYACGHFEFMDARHFPEAWRIMTGVWLPQSGLQFDDRPTFEIYRGDRMMLDDTFRIDICIPVRPL